MNQTETTIGFDGTNIFTLGDAGLGWSYYRTGIKYTLSGSKTIDLLTVDNPLVNSAKYFVYIDSTNGTLSASRTSWTLLDTKVPVAIVAWDSTATPKYLLQEERHSCLIDRRDHWYLHFTRGTQYVSGGTLSDCTAGYYADSSNTFGISQSNIADEDISLTLDPLVDGNGADSTNYTVVYRTDTTSWSWAYSNMPFSYTPSGYINWDNSGTLTQGSGGLDTTARYYNSYLLFTNTVGNARHVIIPGQAEFLSSNSAYGEAFDKLSLTNFPKVEWLAMYQMTWQAGISGLTNKGKVQLTRSPQRISATAISSGNTAISHSSLIDMPDSLGVISDHDVRLVAKVQPNTPTLPTPFKGMFWYDTTSAAPGNTLAVTQISNTYTVIGTDELIVATSGGYTVNLPPATGTGRLLWIKYLGTSTITIDASSSETIDGDLTQSLLQYDNIMVADYAGGLWAIL